MARFRGTVQGGRGESSRLGHKILEGSVDGWETGIDARAYIDMDGRDAFIVETTNGSGSGPMKAAEVVLHVEGDGTVKIFQEGVKVLEIPPAS